MAGFRILRKQLDDLGYYQPLVVDSIPLVEALLHDLLATTSSLKLCREKNESKNNDKQPNNLSKPSAASTPIIPSPIEIDAKTIRLQSRVDDLENLNKECNSIIRRQQIELDEKSRKILKLELSKANSNAKVITQNDRPLIISDSLKPRIEMTRLIEGKQNAKTTTNPSLESKECRQSEIDIVKIYENRNKHLDTELVRLQSELEKAKLLLTQAEKQWQLGVANNKNMNNGAIQNQEELQRQGIECPKSDYMIKLLNDNNRMKAKLSEIDKHSKMCFHGKVIPINPIAPPCCCGHIKLCRGECEPIKPCCKQPEINNASPNFESTRSMVELSHNHLRQSVCIKSRTNKPSQCSAYYGGKENEVNSDKLHEEVHFTQENFRNLQEVNRELRRQVKEITQQKIHLRHKLDHTDKQLNILIGKATNSEKIDRSKIQELITYIESQRDIYKNSVERLLNKLDPNRVSKLAHDIESTTSDCNIDRQYYVKKPPKAILKSNSNNIRKHPNNLFYSQSMRNPTHSNVELNQSPCAETPQGNKDGEVIEISTNTSQNQVESDEKLIGYEVDKKTKENVDDILEEIIRGNNNCVHKPKEELAKANKKIVALETQLQKLTARLNEIEREPIRRTTGGNENLLNHEPQSYCEENSRLNKEIACLRQEIEEIRLHDSLQFQKNKQYVSEIRDSTDTTIEGLQRDIRLFQKEMESLRSQLQTKDSHLHGISREKDALQNQLDEKTTQLEDLKSKYREEKYQLDRLESSKSSQDQRVQDCLNEISLLQNRLREAVTELEKVKSRVDAEKKINREVRQENMTLKEDVYKISTDSEGKDDQIKDLRSNIRTYVTEVKRIEDLLTSREQERGELLEQYKYLSDEVDKSEMHRRQLESQITNLRLDLSTRSAELRATESRLADMEQDLIELSLANESYRSQILTLRQEITKLTSIMEEEKSSINEQKRELRNTTETDKDRRA